MMASLFSGVSGLKNHQVKMNVIGNNIANLNTIGFKPGRVNFQEALVQTSRGAGRPSSVSGGTNPVQMGLGMEVATIDTLYLQGGLETTGQITDLAIQGNGFFILGDLSGSRFYTRAGAFGFDADARLVDPGTGLMVLGKMADASGSIPSFATLSEITLPFDQQDPARATTAVTLANNLNAAASDSLPTLMASGTSGVVTVSGKATDGVGGIHTISIEGEQAKQATWVSNTGGVTLNTTLASLGVNVFDDFSITIDGGDPQPISALNSSSEVQDLINQISQIDGITAALVGGEIEITRQKAGSPADQNLVSSVGVNAGGNVNIANAVFGVPDTVTFDSATQIDVTRRGASSTFVATDSFLPDQGTGAATGPVSTQLGLVYSEATGLVIGLSGIGGSGITLGVDESVGLGRTYDNPVAPLGTDHPLVIQTAPTTHTASISVFDSQGGKHTVSVEFFKSVLDNRWEWSVSTLGDEIVTTGGSGFVNFNSDGSLNTFDYNGGADSFTIDPQNGAQSIQVRFDVGSSGNFDGLTQFASGAHTALITGQDGYGLGILEKISVDKIGAISGIFSNGITRVLAQIMLADFANQGGLSRVGKSMYRPTGNSGAAREGVAGETVGANIFSGALESSAVDVAQEFTAMITAQRGFQANSRIITTSDSMLDELVNIKR
ncbi:MAG: flagellar hook-basal body complex protein [bacterium]